MSLRQTQLSLRASNRRRTLLFITAGIVLACIVIMIVLPVLLNSRSNDQRSRISEDLEPLFVALTTVDDDLLNVALTGAAVADPENASAQAAYETARDQLLADLTEAERGRDALDEEDRGEVDAAIAATRGFIDDVSDPSAEAAAAGDPETAAAIQSELAEERFFTADREIEEAESIVEREVEETRQDIRGLDEAQNYTLAGVGLLALLSGGLVVGLAYQVNRAVGREALARSVAEVDRERLNRVIDSMADGVALFDVNGMPVRVNAAGERMWGIPAEQIMALAPDDVTRPARVTDVEGNDVDLQGLPSTIAIREDREVREMVLVLDHGGEKIDILASAAPIHDESGVVSGAVAVWHDVTELRSVERLKDEFLSFAAHELRTPLTIVKGYASTLSRRLSTPDEQEMARSINEESDRISGLINQLLDVSRMESGSLKFEIAEVRVQGIVEHVVSRHRDIDPGREFSVDNQADGVPCLADAEALRQILDNLLSNARKYSPASKPIRVVVSRRNEDLTIAVSDEGVGIPADELERIGEKLFRASTGRKRKGSGLGLYIARRYLEQQSGRLEIESEVGKGSTFTAVLPCPSSP